MQGIVNKKTGGGFSIQGIIEEYQVASGGNVSAGDFVEFITNIGGNTDTAINSSVDYTGYAISAVVLSNNKVFIAHGYSSSYYLYGMICTIEGSTITAGIDTQLSSIYMSGYAISAVALSDNKVFIAHSYDNSYYLYGIVCTISGTTITAGTDTAINNTHNYTGYAISAVLISNNKVFIAHSYDSGYYYLYGIVCTISGTSITAGTDTSLSTTSYTGYAISAVALSDNKVFIAHSYRNGNYYLYGIVCTISRNKYNQRNGY